MQGNNENNYVFSNPGDIDEISIEVPIEFYTRLPPVNLEEEYYPQPAFHENFIAKDLYEKNSLKGLNSDPNLQTQVPTTKDVDAGIVLQGQMHNDTVSSSRGDVTLTFTDLAYQVQIYNNAHKKDKSQPKHIQREILRGMTGICNPGELTAIMGASGAGKTTLLNVLSVRTTGTKKNILSGEFKANSETYDVRKFSKFAGYVMQNDILLETMTPRETLTFTADLRVEGTKAQRKKKVDHLLSDLKLDKAADTLIGGTFSKGISGGERKRTSIGMELMTDPSLIFLDEPTSGLDSFTAFILIALLKNLAVKGGKTIIFTIHQPSSDIFFMFDCLMMLAKGKFIYQGSVKNAVGHFASIGYQCPEYSNPADYFIEISHSNGVDDQKFEDMYQAYNERIAPNITKQIANVEKSPIRLAHKVNGFFTSCALVAKRSAKDFIRNPILLKGRFIQTLFLIFLICAVWFQVYNTGYEDNETVEQHRIRLQRDINGLLFFYTIVVFMPSAMTVVLTFPTERAVFLKEYGSNMYGVSSYYFGRSSVEIPLILFFPILTTCISYYIVGLNPPAGKFFLFMLNLMLVSLAGNAVGLWCGSMFNDPKVASNVVPAILIPFMLFAGFYINSASMPDWLAWIQWISPFRYSLEALMQNEYSDNAHFDTSQLDAFGFNLGILVCLFALFALGIFIRILALLSLKLLVKRLE